MYDQTYDPLSGHHQSFSSLSSLTSSGSRSNMQQDEQTYVFAPLEAVWRTQLQAPPRVLPTSYDYLRHSSRSKYYRFRICLAFEPMV